MPYLVDLHLHLLPALDDGAPDMDTTLEMAGVLAQLGFTELHATPHQRAGMFMPSAADIEAALGGARTALQRVNPTLALFSSAENYWDDVLAERWRTGTIPGYSTGKAFLFELPGLVPPGLDHELFQMRIRGQLPVLAHPERYSALQEDVARAEQIGRGAALVVDLDAVGGARGRAETKTARILLQERLAHAAATDMHSPADAGALEEGIAWIRKKLGDRELARLMSENPRRILAGEIP